APPAKGVATVQCMAPMNTDEAAPTAEMRAMTASDVARMDCISRKVYFLSAGTTTKPPPTPSRPDRNPASDPDRVSARAHGQVQIRRPSALPVMQGISGEG